MGSTGSKVPTGGKGAGKTKGGSGGSLPGDTQVQVDMTADTARALLRALTLNLPLQGLAANLLIVELSRVLLSTGPKNGKSKGKNGKISGGKTPGGKIPGGKIPGGKTPVGKIPVGKTP